MSTTVQKVVQIRRLLAKKERRFDEFLEIRFFFHDNLLMMTCCGLRSFLVVTVLVTFVVPGHFCAHCCAFSSFLCSLLLTVVVLGHFVLTGVVLGHFCAHCCGSRPFCAHCCGSRSFCAHWCGSRPFLCSLLWF